MGITLTAEFIQTEECQDSSSLPRLCLGNAFEQEGQSWSKQDIENQRFHGSFRMYLFPLNST